MRLYFSGVEEHFYCFESTKRLIGITDYKQILNIHGEKVYTNTNYLSIFIVHFIFIFIYSEIDRIIYCLFCIFYLMFWIRSDR